LSAYRAYGVALIVWRGLSVVNGPEPALRTEISIQRACPSNAADPKSSWTAKRPLESVRPDAASVGPTCKPPDAESYSLNSKSVLLLTTLF
jgi:hypothetical protein